MDLFIWIIAFLLAASSVFMLLAYFARPPSEKRGAVPPTNATAPSGTLTPEPPTTSPAAAVPK